MFDFTFGGGKIDRGVELIFFSSRRDYNLKLEFVALESTIDF